MEIQDFFYWVASVVLILFGLFTIVLFALVFYIKKLADRMSDQVGEASRAWRNLTVTRFVLRTLKFFF